MAGSSAAAETRVALVIGESNYAYWRPLQNPVQDAEAVADTLRSAGFSQIMIKTDLNVNDLRATLAAFAAVARHADVAVIYYAGHGMEIRGANYLIPINARISDPADAEFEAVTLDLVMKATGEARRLGLVLLDACRNNPLPQRRSTFRSAEKQTLAPVEPTRSNNLVVYATRDGSPADDGDRHSPFASALMRRLPTPGLEIGLLFREVHDDVLAATKDVQEPVMYGALSGQSFYFVPGASGAAPPVATAPVVDPRAIEIAFWESINGSANPVDFQAYLAQYPTGAFSAIARNRLTSSVAAITEPEVAEASTHSEAEAWSEWTRSIQFAGRSQTIIEFINKYPQGPHVRPAQQRILDLKAQGK